MGDSSLPDNVPVYEEHDPEYHDFTPAGSKGCRLFAFLILLVVLGVIAGGVMLVMGLINRQ